MTKTFSAIFLSLAIVCDIASAAEDAPRIRAFVDKNIIHIGDRIEYTIEVNAKKNIDLALPKFEEGRVGDFEIKDSKSSIRKSLFRGRRFFNIYSITIFSTGLHEIPAVSIKYKRKGAGREWLEKKTQLINITVESVLPKDKMPSDIKDIKGPLGFFEINWLLVGAIAFIILLLVTATVIKKRKKVPVKSLHESILEELEAIEGSFAQKSDAKEYYVGISDCIRRYIEKRFSLRAPEMTTEEFLNSLRNSSGLSSEHKALLKDFLASCDLVKFAKYAPVRQEIESVFSTAKKFVEETKEIHA